MAPVSHHARRVWIRILVTAAAVAFILGSGPAWAEPSGQADRFMKDAPKVTVYATDDHMGSPCGRA
jgi:hypothetical protein